MPIEFLPHNEEETVCQRVLKKIQDADMDLNVSLIRERDNKKVVLRTGTEALPISRASIGLSWEDAAEKAKDQLKEVMDKHKDYIQKDTGRTAVMELNILAHHLGDYKGQELKRHFVKKLAPKDAMVELELSDEPGMIFFDMDKGRPSVMLNYKDGGFSVLSPGYDETGGAGVETSFKDLTLEKEEKAAPETKDLTSSPSKLNRFREILRCPSCNQTLQDARDALLCQSCEREYEIKNEIPILLPEPDMDPEPDDSPISKNPYGQQTLQMINKLKDGLILDCGSGCPSVCFSNVVHLEIVRYPGVDIVASGEKLPFADQSFDAVISEAVLEHVQTPFAYVKELYRVLKPGGEIRVDAAFMQPYHAYPHHYFNMTLSGLELLMKDFVKIDSGCGPHQQPYVTLDLVLQGLLQHMTTDAHRKKAEELTLKEILVLLEEQGEKGPFQSLTKEGVSKLAAGFYYYGYRPKS